MKGSAPISDVVMHVRYTARDGGAAYASTVRSTLLTELSGMDTGESNDGVKLMASVRYDDPDAWYAFHNPDAGESQVLTLAGLHARLPFALQGVKREAAALRLVLLVADGVGGELGAGPTTNVVAFTSKYITGTTTTTGLSLELNKSTAYGEHPTTRVATPVLDLPDTLELTLDETALPTTWQVSVGSDTRLDSSKVVDLLVLFDFTVAAIP